MYTHTQWQSHTHAQTLHARTQTHTHTPTHTHTNAHTHTYTHTRTCKKALMGAMPVPGPTMITGRVESAGNLKLEARKSQRTVAPGDS